MSNYSKWRVIRNSWEVCSIYDEDNKRVAELHIREDDGEESVDERALPLADTHQGPGVRD